jgi:tRNA threonylcarbamoyl adenosine modification protein (Sua5/YciO/YrdC/YwlC family)
MSATFIKIHPDNPQIRLIEQVVDCLNKGGVIIYPTDTVYAIGCCANQIKSIDRITQLKKNKKDKQSFTFICKDLAQVAFYTKPFPTPIFKCMKRTLPGPYTFILEANNKVPQLLLTKRKTIGIRICYNKILNEIIERLEYPLVSTSVKNEDDILEYITDPIDIETQYKKLVDLIIDGEVSNNIPSTVVDCTNNDLEIIREGLGDINLLY